MIVAKTISAVHAAKAAAPGLSWGFVPTMGYLHDGHLSLVRMARAANDRVAVSIYVNPAQFAPTEDLASYPRDLQRDLELLQAEGVDLVFTPDDAIMYPPGFQTTVTVGEVTRLLEGASRSTHFQGVTTVVAKLFNIVAPNRAYFGQKDAQQVVVVKRMVADLNVDLEIVVGPIVREPDGLAMSSRNTRLSPAQRAAAPVLYRALSAAQAALQAGERSAAALRQQMEVIIAAEPLASLDYASVADAETLQELDTVAGRALLSLAVRFGSVRLIDNMPVEAAP
jgi:pantoate--beta-alanine ligase